MAVYKRDIVDINLETGNIHRSFLQHSIGQKDDDADRFGIRAYRNGVPVDLSGCSCHAWFLNSQGTTLALTDYGTVDGNEAYVTLPQACYDYNGQFCLAIKLVGGGISSTVRIVDGMVDNIDVGGAVSPTSEIPDYSDILAQYDAMVAATSAANTAIAETFDATKAYPAGKYVINSGALYRLTADHAANVTWANTSKVAAKFGDDLSDLKSAFESVYDYTGVPYIQVTANRFVNCTNGAVGSGSYTFSYATDYIEVIPSANMKIENCMITDHTIESVVGMAFYDKNKTYISNSGISYSDNFNGEFTVPSTAAYMRLTVYNDGIDKYQIIIKKGDIIPEITNGLNATKNDVDYLYEYLGEEQFTAGYFYNYTNGNKQSNGSYYISDLIPCDIVDIYVKTYCDNDASGICYYDADKNFIDGFNPYSISGIIAKLTPPEKAKYVGITCMTTQIANGKIFLKNVIPTMLETLESAQNNADKAINANKSAIEPSKNLLPNAEKNTTVNLASVTYEDGVLKITGTPNDNGGRYTKVVPDLTLPAGTYIFSRENVKTTGEATIHLTYGSTLISASQAGTRFTLSSETSAYISLTLTKDVTYDIEAKIQIEKSTYKTDWVAPSDVSAIDRVSRTVLDDINANGRMYAYAMRKTLHIGDSLTKGILYTSGATPIQDGYPLQFGRMIDAEPTNAGFSGFSSKMWYNQHAGDYTYSNYDTFFIWLGTNDGLTDTLDTDVTPYDDYNDYADTDTGCYCKIIEKIKEEHGGTCLIVLVKIFATSHDGVVSTTNEVIDKIAQKYSLPVIDNSDLGYAVHPELHNNTNDVHFGKAGYIYIANRFITEVSKYLAEDPTRCEFSYFYQN